MSFSWGFILLNVEKEGTPSTALGPKMGMEPTSLSRTLKTMEEKGYIVRRADNIDKRKSLVFLTEKGIDARRETKEIVFEFNRKLYNSIPKAKVRAFFEAMNEIDNILTDLLEEQK